MEKRLRLSFYISVILLMAVVSCQLDVPVKEMMDAKLAIKRAYEVKADKYDSKNLDAAIQSLYKTHDLLKEEKDKDAKKMALESLKQANDAIATSLPLLARDTLSEAKTIFKEADDLNAVKYANAEYKKAESEIKESENFNNVTSYWKSHLESKKAIASGRAARDKALAAMPGLTSRIEDLKKENGALKSHEFSSIATQEISAADVSIGKAESSITKKLLKDLDSQISEAEKNINLARAKIDAKVENEKKIAQAKEKIEALNKEIANLKSNRGNEIAPDDIAKAETSIGSANESLSGGNVDDALTHIATAENSIKAALAKVAKEKLDSVGKLYDSIKEKDPKDKFKEQLDQASGIIQSSKQHFESSAYNKSIAKSDEADKLLRSTSIEIEKMLIAKGKGITVIKHRDPVKGDTKIYVVRWRKKNTDCMWRIAQRVYKNARLWPFIYRANRDQIKDPDLIFPGQRFVIPDIEDIKREIQDKKEKRRKSKNKTTDIILRRNEG